MNRLDALSKDTLKRARILSETIIMRIYIKTAPKTLFQNFIKMAQLVLPLRRRGPMEMKRSCGPWSTAMTRGSRGGLSARTSRMSPTALAVSSPPSVGLSTSSQAAQNVQVTPLKIPREICFPSTDIQQLSRVRRIGYYSFTL